MIAADEDRLERVRDNIDAAENEYVKYTDMITDKKNKLEMLTSKENELVERTKIAENVYDMFRHGGDDDVREKLIDVMYENQRLQKENKSLLENNKGIMIDYLYIDEAHNLFTNDSRNVLLPYHLQRDWKQEC